MAFDAFLKLTTTTGQQVQGESQDKVHLNEIELNGYNLGAVHPTNVGSATGGAGAGKATFNDFSFTTPSVSKVTPILFQACAQGTRYSSAIVYVSKAGGSGPGTGVDYLTITMGTVFVSSFTTGGPSGDAAPHDEIRLAYGSLKIQYIPQGPNGTAQAPVSGGWDVVKNAPA